MVLIHNVVQVVVDIKTRSRIHNCLNLLNEFNHFEAFGFGNIVEGNF